MRNTHIEISPIAGALGAEIGGVDVAQDLDGGVIGEIRQALAIDTSELDYHQVTGSVHQRRSVQRPVLVTEGSCLRRLRSGEIREGQVLRGGCAPSRLL